MGIADLSALADNYGAGSGGVVPEPMTLSLLAVGAAAVMWKRRRK
ncbi:MAG: PEP-CTERM sorting domain-containing protein [Planctomycetota bacterium]